MNEFTGRKLAIKDKKEELDKFLQENTAFLNMFPAYMGATYENSSLYQVMDKNGKFCYAFWAPEYAIIARPLDHGRCLLRFRIGYDDDSIIVLDSDGSILFQGKDAAIMQNCRKKILFHISLQHQESTFFVQL